MTSRESPLDTAAQEDVLWMCRCRDADDTAAFEKLVVRHQKTLVNFFMRLGVYSHAEDLTQETFVRIYRYRDRYVPSAKFTTFLFLIARQVWVDELRREKRRARLTEALQKEMDAENQPTHSVSDAEQVRRVVARLPESVRLVVELAVFQDLPYKEIAIVLNIPEGTVKSRMFHALKKLKTMLMREAKGGSDGGRRK